MGISISKDKYENNDVAGVVTGLAWTQFGGDILFIESALSRGKGNLSITGNLGKVMKESATIALEYIKSNADLLSIDVKKLSIIIFIFMSLRVLLLKMGLVLGLQCSHQLYHC